MAQKYGDVAWNYFDSKGKLIAIEYGLEAVYNSGQIITLKGGKHIVFLSKKLPKLGLLKDVHKSIYKISQKVFINITGLPADVTYVVSCARSLASSLEEKMARAIEVPILARCFADKFQVYIQKTEKRAPAFGCTFFGFSDDIPSIYYTDISSVLYPCKAMAIGEENSKMIKHLEKEYTEEKANTLNGLLTIGISSLLESMGGDIGSNEIEVGYISIANDSPVYLNEQEIESILQKIAETSN